MHNLTNIMDYNKIIVLNNGNISLFDTPKNVLKYGNIKLINVNN